jgi:hypothetical protein
MRIVLMIVLTALPMLAGCAEEKSAQSSASATSTDGSTEAKKPRNNMMGEPPTEPP